MADRNAERRTSRLTSLLVPLLALGLTGLLSSCADSSEPSGSGGSTTGSVTTANADDGAPAVEGTVHEFVIPEGTAERVALGETPEVIPRRIDAYVGDEIRIRNDDTEIARLGIFDIGPGETMTMNFTEERVLTGTLFSKDPAGCGSPPTVDEAFVINVRPLPARG